MTRVIEKVAWVRLEAGRLLAARSHGRDLFYLPGGKPEPGESPEQTLVREIREELGVTLDPATVAPFAIVEAPAAGKPGGHDRADGLLHGHPRRHPAPVRGDRRDRLLLNSGGPQLSKKYAHLFVAAPSFDKVDVLEARL